MTQNAKKAATQRVFWGDARSMGDLADDSVHLVVTSPPYWQLKDYGAPEQIGFHDTYEEYVFHLNTVWAECRRVLHPGCRLCVNIGDQFARAAFYGRYKVIALHEAVIHGCEALGLDYMGAIIWQKSTTMNTSGGGSVMGSFPHPRNGIIKIDYEFILLFKKLGTAPRVSAEQKAASKMTTPQWNEYFNGHWNFPGERQGDGHIAMFPLELPRRLIRMFSFPGETVLDPFLGSGTTLRAAAELERSGVGYEINRDFAGAIEKRLQIEAANPDAPDVQFLDSSASKITARTPTAAAHSLTRQTSAAPSNFKSVIELGDAEKPRERGVKVREVLAPDQLRLEGGGVVHLRGIRPRDGKEQDAMLYLQAKLLNRPVFLKHAETGETEPAEGALSAYVYMQNKTFINAKLIKEGLAEADPNVCHPHAARFLQYQEKVV